MSLLDHAIWWQVYPLGAAGVPMRPSDEERAAVESTPGDGLARLIGWLDHVVELGCSGLLLGPIFASTSHGYDTLDHFRIDPRLGTEAAFDALVAAARERGLAVMLDGVFNHVGADHPLVHRALAGEEGFVRITHGDDGAPRLPDWEGHGGLVELDHGSPAVADLVTDVMCHWLARGIAGWRLDVAYAVPPAFWREVTARVRERFPDAIFLGEVIHGDYAAIAEAGRLDSVTQYELWKAIRGTLTDANFFELAHALERHAAFSAGRVLNTFVGNHDVERIATTLEGADGGRLTGDDGAALAAAILLTVPGMPSIYYGDEYGFRGGKGAGFAADDALRPPLPSSPAEVRGGADMLRLHQDLIGLRRRHPWLASASVRVEARDNRWITYESFAADHVMRVHVTLDPVPRVAVVADGGRNAGGEEFHWQGHADGAR